MNSPKSARKVLKNRKNMGKNGQSAARSPRNVYFGEVVKKPKIRTKRSENEDWHYFEQHEMERLFSVITSKRDAAIFRLVYHHGLRTSEVGKLQYLDWSPRDKSLFIYRGKNSVSRVHRLIDAECRALNAWIKVRGTKPGPLFPSRNHRPISRARLDDMIKEYCQKAGIRSEKAHMHALKHSCGTHLAERGNLPDTIQDWLGHRSPMSTQIYMHFSRRRREEVLEKNRDWK